MYDFELDYKPEYIKFYSGGSFITDSTEIRTDIPIIRKTIQKIVLHNNEKDKYFKYINFIKDIPEDVVARIKQELNTPYVQNEEGYIIDINSNCVNVYSTTDRGLFYGCLTLVKLYENHYIKNLLAYEYPVCPERGIKIYLPDKNDIDYFKKLIDMICYYKYNTVMIEVGGAMEYKNHPEINEGWVEYCREMNEYSGKANKIQEHTFDWKKNSIHAENGGGNYLSQETVRSLVNYCKERYLNVIPEVPSLSHCDYLLLRHHEISERADDPYSDTYCPSNPKSYELLFDVLKEVIDVFKPSVINIGHDEYYSIGICDKCKNKKAEDIYADDITKIHDFLAGFDIKTMIWGDKLLNAYLEGYGPCGGAERELISPITGKSVGFIPPTYASIDLVPKDTQILHWYWSIDKNYENEFLKRNMDVRYGNFSPMQFPDWINRIKKGIKGAIISNWSALKEQNLQRNGMLFGIVFGHHMFWKHDFEDKDYEIIRDKTFKELYKYKYHNMLSSDAKKNENITFIEIIHTTDLSIKYKEFVDGEFISMDVYKIGDYIITYEDNSRINIPIVYGTNISNKNPVWQIKRGKDIYDYDRSLIEVSYTTLPVAKEGVTYYKFLIKNPYPNKKIKGIQMVNSNKYDCNIFLNGIKLVWG